MDPPPDLSPFWKSFLAEVRAGASRAGESSLSSLKQNLMPSGHWGWIPEGKVASAPKPAPPLKPRPRGDLNASAELHPANDLPVASRLKAMNPEEVKRRLMARR